MMRFESVAMAGLAVLLGCAGSPQSDPTPYSARAAAGDTLQSWQRPQYTSTYARRPSGPVVIRNATVLTAAGPELQGASVVIADGAIVAVGSNVATPAGATIIDGQGKWVTPGFIDTHSHIGVYAAPGTSAESDGNEATSPVTAEVWAEHSIWPQDPQIPLAIAGGITVAQILPGSAASLRPAAQPTWWSGAEIPSRSRAMPTW
jgi:hypothetical protein